MIVYASEIEDGLEEQIKANSTVAYESPLLLEGQAKAGENMLFLPSSAFANLNSVEGLYRIYSILVTSNWNKNDDVFGPEIIWAARHTPEDKPFNIEHKPRQIIGHITHCVAVDDSYTVIDENTNVDKLPEKYHILTSAVIYEHLRSKDVELTKETSELIESIAKGEWYVSMEAMFNDFDYAVSKDGKEYSILSRKSTTAHLTKHLRVCGGQGEYQGYKIGRYLKDVTFSGKGLVKKPGNPESYIFNDTLQFKGAFANSLFEKLPENEKLVSNNNVNGYKKEVVIKPVLTY